MATGKRLLSNCMPANYKQGTLIPTYRYWTDGFDFPYGNRCEVKRMLVMFVRLVRQNCVVN